MSNKLITIFFCLGFSFCIQNNHFSSGYEDLLQDPLLAYRKGHYRQVVEYFNNNTNAIENLEFRYILGSSYLELKEYEKAFEQFYQIDYNELYNSQYNYIYPFFVRRYVNVLIELEDNKLLTPEEKAALLDMIHKVDANSPVRKYFDQELFSILWKSESYRDILALDKNVSKSGKAWIELAKCKLGKSYDVKPIIANQKLFSNNLAYTNILLSLEPKNFRKKSDLSNLIEMSLRVKPHREKALEFADRYNSLFGDQEYYTKINAQKLLLDGERDVAADLVYQYLKQNPKARLDMYIFGYEFLINRKKFEWADEIAVQAHEKYNHKFYKKVKSGIEFHRNADYVLSWYKRNYQKISKEEHLQVIRSLIRADLKKAEMAVDLGVSVNKEHSQFLLLYALIKEHFNKREEAYQYYLRLIFQDAFGYAGIVAKDKEKAMRNEFRSYFETVTRKIVKKIPSYELKERLMLYKSFLVDDELAQYVDKKKMERDQRQFNKLVYADLNKVKNIPVLDRYPKNLSNFAIETQDYVENSVLEAMTGDSNWHNTARYFYKYRNLFINSDIDGYLTFRLYFYIRDQHGYKYLPNYPKEIVDLVFPKPEFDLIKEWSGDDLDLAYWMLSSFMAESHFRKRVYSKVGAVGFAQVMPYTAKDIKRWKKKPYLSNYDFYDNLRMGVFYHKKMYDDMNKNILLSLAAYNAGPGAVKRWVNKYSHIKDEYLLVEAMEYEETRNYVKIITYNHGMYRLLNDNDLY